MPTIIILADESAAELTHATLTERIVAENLHDDHYATQLMQRLRWAAADAEAVERGSTRRLREARLREPLRQAVPVLS